MTTKTKVIPRCGAHLKGHGAFSDGCSLPGVYDGRCKRHRAPTPEERATHTGRTHEVFQGSHWRQQISWLDAIQSYPTRGQPLY